MSTLGGSKGERHAKPTKFTQLDINKLYSSSRGESLEPSSQKNAVPRKHGMQSLGKVPSARRPPANLPSLKAETSTPTDPSASWGSETSQSSGTATSTIAAAAATTISGSNNVSATNTSAVVSSSNSVTSLNSNSISSTLVSSSNQSNTSSATSSTTWSSVATGAPVEIAQPPLYQSPQFQHEFPSLDGSAPAPSKGNRNQDSHQINSDGQHMSLRPQTDAASWMQTQQGGTGNRGENGNSQVSQQDPGLQQVPPHLRALMPQFMYRSGNSAGIGGAQPPNQFGLQQQITGSGINHPPPPIQVKQRSQTGSGSHQSYNDEFNSTHRRDDRAMQQRRGPPHSNRPINRYDGSGPYVEPEEPLIPRPIIKEEDLNRMDSLAKDDGWAKCDEIDYNQKLVFSDDEDVPVKETISKNEKKGSSNRDTQRHDEDNRAVWNRERERERERERDRERESKEQQERAKLEREREREREKNERNERERANDKDRDNRSDLNPRIQQNGHRGGLDADVVERVKQRKEEEEKQAYERKQAASKKLQELEQKISKKKELDENHISEQASKSDGSDFRLVSNESGNRFNRETRGDREKEIRGDRDRDRDGRERDYGRYDKYERDINSRERDGSYKDNYGHSRDRGNERDNSAMQFSRPFQSNLPPRFQKQHQHDRDSRGGFSGPGSGGGMLSNYSFNRNNSSNNNYSNDQKNIPFTQPPYENRYNSHSQSNYKQQLGPSSQMRRHPSDEMMPGRRNERKRMDSEEEDRYSGNRETSSRNSTGEKPPTLNRSISDSSQRKTSVSSEDKPLDGSFRSDRSDSKELTMSWADDMETEMNRMDIRSESPSANKATVMDNQPKHILQRQPKISESSRDEKDKSEERDLKSSASEKETSPPVESPPKVWADCLSEVEGGKAEKSVETNVTSSSQKSGSEEKKSETVTKSGMSTSGKEEEKASVSRPYSSAGKDMHSSDDGKHVSKVRANSRGGNRGGSSSGRHDTRDQRGGYNSYRGSWGNRRGGSRTNRYDYYTESEGSDDPDDHRSDRNYKGQRKDVGNLRHETSRHGGSIPQQQQKEGFAPRGEPSRRGRGASNSTAPPFRRGGSSAPKRIVIGPPSSKSPFGESDEKLECKKDMKADSGDDKTKLNQMALSAALSGKKSPSGAQDNQARPTGGQIAKKDESYESTSELSDSQENRNKNRSGGGKLAMSSSSGSIVSNKNIPRDEKKTSPKPSFGGPPRKDERISGSKSESQTMKKDESSNENVDKKPVKKDDGPVQSHNPQRNQNVQSSNNRNKPRDDRQNIQQIKSSSKPMSGSATKSNTPSGPSQISQQSSQQGGKPIQDRSGRMNHSVSKIAPRFAKQRQQRSDQINGSQMQNAWEKPLGSSDTESMSHNVDDSDANNDTSRNTSRQAPNVAIGEKSDLSINLKTDNSKQHLDGTSPPVNTIIFENTNYKSIPPIKRQTVPQQQQQSQQQPQQQPATVQLDKKEDVFKNSSAGTFQDMLDAQQQMPRTASQQQSPQQQSESISTVLQTMSFPKPDVEYEKDMKLGFSFESEISQLTDDKTTSKALGMPRSAMHSGSNTAQNTIISPSAELNMKIASVKKVWDPMPTVMEHSTPDDSHLSSNFTSQHQQHMHQFTHGHVTMAHVQHALSPGPGSYSASFGADPSLEQHFAKATQEEVESGYNPSTQHVGQGHHPMKHSTDVLATSTNVCKVKPTQQQLHQSAIGLSPPPMQQTGIQSAPPTYYQPTQFGGISAIPSPPAVLYNSSPMQNQANVYGHFSMDTSRSQFSQFPAHYGGTASTPYNYMQTPSNLPTTPNPDMYQNITSQFRINAAVQAPFNQTQQLSNPSTVLISSTANSLMSASVKPSSQQIGAIGSKSGAVGQPYPQQYMNLYPQQAPPLQSNSYYSNSAGGQGTTFFGPTAGATQGYGLPTASMFGGHAPAPSSAPPPPQQQYNSAFLTNSPLLAINRQYPGPTPQNANAPYIKSNQQQSHVQDPSGRQLKSPLNSDGGLNLKQQQSQQSPPHHKNYVAPWEQMQNQVLQQQQQQQNRSGVSQNNNNSGRQGPGPQRYPSPIQRPNYPPQHQQQPQQNQQQQRSIRQPHSGQVNSGPMNKHYYSGGGRGGHVSAGPDQAITGKPTSDKPMENSSVAQDASKEDGQND